MLLRSPIGEITGIVAGALALLALGGCAPTGSDLPPLPPAPAVASAYILGPGDKLQIQVFGADDVNGQYTVSDSGMVGAPLIGEVKASGRTVAELQQTIADKLAQGYIKDPKVGVEVLTYRPFYIVGEVNHPGAYPYNAGATVVSAVAKAGGYTYRAADGMAVIERKEHGETIRGRGGPTTPILPGDVITIPERYF